MFSQYVLVDGCLVDIARDKRLKIGDSLSLSLSVRACTCCHECSIQSPDAIPGTTTNNKVAAPQNEDGRG